MADMGALFLLVRTKLVTQKTKISINGSSGGMCIPEQYTFFNLGNSWSVLGNTVKLLLEILISSSALGINIEGNDCSLLL